MASSKHRQGLRLRNLFSLLYVSQCHLNGRQNDHLKMERESESCSVVSDSLWPHELYSPWISSGQNTGVGSLSLLQGIFPTQVFCIAGRFFTSWATGEAPNWNLDRSCHFSSLKFSMRNSLIIRQGPIPVLYIW